MAMDGAAAVRRAGDAGGTAGVSSPVLVTGGSGFVAGAVLARLVGPRPRGAGADALRAVGGRVRRAAGAQPVRGDMMDAASLARAMEGVGSSTTSRASTAPACPTRAS